MNPHGDRRSKGENHGQFAPLAKMDDFDRRELTF